MAIKKILVPIDGSTNAFRSLDVAISIAKPTGASVVVAHSANKAIGSEFGKGEPSWETHKVDVDRFLRRASDKLKRHGIKHKNVVVHESPGYGILKLAHSKSEKFDLIVIGSSGRGYIKKMFFGSTSNYVMHSARIPVLVVK